MPAAPSDAGQSCPTSCRDRVVIGCQGRPPRPGTCASAELLPDMPSYERASRVAAQALRHDSPLAGACKVAVRLRFGYVERVHHASITRGHACAGRGPVTWRTTLRSLRGVGARHRRPVRARPRGAPTRRAPRVSSTCVVRMQDAPSAPGACGLRPQAVALEHPVRRARGRSASLSGEPAASIRRGPVAIRRQCHPWPSAVTGDRHISNDRTRHPRCAMGDAPGRDRRAECPPMPGRQQRLATHRSPA